MSLSAALSIFAPPSGAAPSAGEAVTGDEGAFAGLIAAGAGETPVNPTAKATRTAHVSADSDIPAPSAYPVDATASSIDGSLTPQPVSVAPPLNAFAAHSVGADAAPSQKAGAPEVDITPVAAPAPSPEPALEMAGRVVQTDRSLSGTPSQPAVSGASSANPAAEPVVVQATGTPETPATAIGATATTVAASETVETIAALPLQAHPQPPAPLAAPEPSKPGTGRPAGRTATVIEPSVRASAKPGESIDLAIQTEAEPTVKVDPTGSDAERDQATITGLAADLVSQIAGRAPSRRSSAQVQALGILQTLTAEKGAPATLSDEAAAPGVNPVIVKAVRGVVSPPTAAPPPIAPALAPVLQGGGNAPVVSAEVAAPDAIIASGSDRGAVLVKTAAEATIAVAAATVVTRPQAETVPTVPTAPVAPDAVAPEGRVEPAPETPPATPTTISASSLSRASIETTALLSAQIARRLEGRSTRFDMALTPEGLGRVDVRVEIDRDGQLAARLAFDNPAAATELRGRADELRRQLEDAGFTLSQDALDFSEREPSSGGQGAFERQQRRAAYAHRLSSEPDLTPVPATWSTHPGTPRGVDVKV